MTGMRRFNKERRDYNKSRIPESVDLVEEEQVEADKPTKHTLQLVLDTLQRRDAYELFAEPVDSAEVEDYYEIIKDPMDFGTMRAKLHEDMYQSLQQFQHDVFLIFKNAMHFNPSTSVYFKQARILQDMATKVFNALKTDPNKFEVEADTTKRRSVRKIHNGDRDSYTNSERTGLLTRDKSSLTPILNVDIPKDLDLTKTLMHICEQDITYRESLAEFVKDLGPTAKRVAQRKLQEAESSKINDVIITNPCANNNNKKTAQKASSSSSPPQGMKRKTKIDRRLIMNKKIVLAVPAACHARSYRSCRSAAGSTDHVRKKDAVQRLPKQRKTEFSERSTEANKGENVKDTMIAPSWQVKSSFDVNTSLIGSYRTGVSPQQRIPENHHQEKNISVFGMSINTVKNAASSTGYQYQRWQKPGSSGSNIGRDNYFDMSYIRSKLNGSI